MKQYMKKEGVAGLFFNHEHLTATHVHREQLETAYAEVEAGTAEIIPWAEPVVLTSKDSAKDQIDIAAGAARAKFSAPGELIDQEYLLVSDQVKKWRDASSPADNVPTAITAWATASGQTNEQAASDIETTSAEWNSVLMTIREIRLVGKKAIDDATAENVDSVLSSYLGQLKAVGDLAQ